MQRPKVLIVEDDETTRFGIAAFLRNNSFATLEAESCAQAENVIRSGKPNVIVADYQLPDGTALELLERLQRVGGQTPLILLTGHGSIDLAVHAMRCGAEHFLTKPVALPALQQVIEKAIEKDRVARRQFAEAATRRRTSVDPFIGNSPALQALRDDAHRLLDTDRPVCLRGETGTGKGVLARWLHEHSSRGQMPMVELNCAGLPAELLESELFGHEKGSFTGAVATKTGLMEAADGGTLFLDEIGDLELQLQPKLLKAVEDGRIRRVGDTREIEVDVRLIAATHRDLAAAVRQSKFRDDLYFRISTFTLQLPPLRERRSDITELTRVILDRLAEELARETIGVRADALAALQSYSWPGNIRELHNVLERAVLFAGRSDITREHLALDAGGRAADQLDGDMSRLTLEELEQRQIATVLQQETGSVERAAQRLGISRSSLYQKLKVYRIAR